MQGRLVASFTSPAAKLFGTLVALSMVLGLLGAGLFMPVVGATGLTIKEALDTFDRLPKAFTSSPMAQQTRILASDGRTVLATLYQDNREVVPLKAISPLMIKAQLAIEDDRYYEHGGIDPKGIGRALMATVLNNRQGASTITQQYVKQTLLNQALSNEDAKAAAAATTQKGIAGVMRKVQEAKYSLELEKQVTKDQILEGYLNLVYYGAQAYGVEAASKRYFGISAKDVNLSQAATLAGLVQRPGATDPIGNPKAAFARRNEVLARMKALGWITPAEYDKTVKEPIKLNPVQGKASCMAAAQPYVCEYIKKWAMQNVSALGADRKERDRMLYRGGLTIKTTFDAALMKASQEVVAKEQERHDKEHPGRESWTATAAATVEPGTGKVLTIAQGSEYRLNKTDHRHTTINYAVPFNYGGSGGFSIGSTAKMFAVVAGVEKGYDGNHTFVAPPDGTTFSIRESDGDCKVMAWGGWPVKNAEPGESGPTTLARATAMSINTAFAAFDQEVGFCKIKDVMKRMGLTRTTYAEGKGWVGEQVYGDPPRPGEQSSPSALGLGSDNSDPLTVANAYATLASGGKACTAVPIESITTLDGKKFDVPKSKCTRALTPKVAFGATQIMQNVMDPAMRGTGSGLNLEDGRVSAGKTGTAENHMQTWFAGFTPQRSTAAWLGTPVPRVMREQVFGATYAGPMWQGIMNAANKGLPKEPFRQLGEDDKAQDGGTTVPDVSGKGRYSAERALRDEGFEVVISETRVPSEDVRAGRVAATSPKAGTNVAKGATITILISSGSPNGDSNNEDKTTPGTAPSPSKSRTKSPSPSVSERPTKTKTPKPKPSGT